MLKSNAVDLLKIWTSVSTVPVTGGRDIVSVIRMCVRAYSPKHWRTQALVSELYSEITQNLEKQDVAIK